MVEWSRECGGPGVSCPHQLPGIEGTTGVTAMAYCLRTLDQSCPVRFTRGHVELGVVAGMPIVAGCYLARIRGRRPEEIWDVLPAIQADEWEILLKFCRDYTRRRVPWAVVARGAVYALIKLRVV